MHELAHMDGQGGQPPASLPPLPLSLPPCQPTCTMQRLAGGGGDGGAMLGACQGRLSAAEGATPEHVIAEEAAVQQPGQVGAVGVKGLMLLLPVLLLLVPVLALLVLLLLQGRAEGELVEEAAHVCVCVWGGGDGG